jgi:hypothetical protein
MRRFFTLVCLLCLAIPAGISISGCTRNPAGNYCPVTSGYGMKLTDVASITLQPQTSGISLAFGQTQQIQMPSANTCTGAGASVNSSQYTYGTTNNQLVDISPTGTICAGTWNRNSGGGIADYTVCNKPNPLPNSGGLPYGTAYITASADSVTSNPVEVYVHAQVTSIALVGPQQCQSQGVSQPLAAQACYSSGGQQVLLCKPATTTDPDACPLPTGVSAVPSCSTVLGTLNFSVGTPSVATINSTNDQITAQMPGTTAITASVAGSGSSAGYFSTCPPQSINIRLANGATTGTVTQGVQQNLTTTVLDTRGANITGLVLDYQTTDPIDLSVASGGITPRYPGVASVYAMCQPADCNPAPIEVVGQNGTGLSITSNPVIVTTPGTASDYVWFASPGMSQYFDSIDLLTGTLSSTVRLPYVPNSMVMDRGGENLYFGSTRELMVFSTSSNAIAKQDTSVPGVVLAVSPNNSLVLINDQVRQVFYLYSAAAGGSTTFGGLGAAAQWTPDSKTLYVTDSAALNNPSAGITGHTNTLYVYNVNTGWTTYDLSASGGSQNVAITIPSVGAYLSGSSTVARTWCPSGTVGNAASILFYPQGDLVPVQTDTLAATTDGQHILGAAMVGGGVTLSDIGVTIPTTACTVTTSGTGATQVQTLSPLNITHTLNQAQIAPPSSLGNVNALAVNQVVASPASNLAFVTYTANPSNTKALLPYYQPVSGSTSPTGALGTLGYVALTGSSAISAPLVGAFTPDDAYFFVSTAGDNKIHQISISATKPPADTQQISPNLPACTPVVDLGCTLTTPSAGPVPTTAIAVVPRATT